MKKIPHTFWLGILAGIVFFALAAYYWLTPAGSLAPFMPGFEAGSSTVHVKHGIAAALLGFLALVYAWFQSAPLSAAPQK